MQPNPEVRASDADRDRVAEMLREHCAQGRITIDELEERLEHIYTAKTLGALQQVTADLPEEDLYELPVPARVRASTVPARRGSGGIAPRGFPAAWATWAGVTLMLVTIWLIGAVSGGALFPWWIWVTGPWGAAILANQIFRGRGPDDSRH